MSDQTKTTILPYVTLTSVDDNGDIKIKELSYDDIHMNPQLPKPTTQECIDWLWHDKEDPWSPESTIKAETIRAQLLSAQEMAKALEYAVDKIAPCSHSECKAVDGLVKSYAAWRKVGGQ